MVFLSYIKLWYALNKTILHFTFNNFILFIIDIFTNVVYYYYLGISRYLSVFDINVITKWFSVLITRLILVIHLNYYFILYLGFQF